MDIRKRGFPFTKPNGAAKKFKSESEFLSSGIRSKSKPCMKYFSIEGCPFGENCHFLHFFPGGYNAVAQLMNLPPISTASATTQNGPTSAVKSKLCNRYSTPEGCKFGDQCNFAHGDWELGEGCCSNARGPTNPRTNSKPPCNTKYCCQLWCLCHCQNQCRCFPRRCYNWNRRCELKADLQTNRSQTSYSAIMKVTQI